MFSPVPASPATDPSCRRDLLLLIVVLGLFFFALLGIRPLANPDEGRYAEIPREMAASGDYVTPRLDGVKYFEKPPLLYWLSAATIQAVGFSEFKVRFWCAALAATGGLITYCAGRSLYNRETGLAAAVILSTNLLYYALSRLITLDLAVSVFMAGALFAFIAGIQTSAGPQRRWLFWAFYASMAMATLTKGLIGIVLPLAVIFLWLVLLKKWRDLRPFYPFSGALILLGLAAPWHLLAGLANHSAIKERDFTWFYFVHEHFQRFTTQEHGRYQPWWFFVPILLAGFFPWVAFLFQALKSNLAGGWQAREQNDVAWFLVIWAALIFAFFSKSQSKLIPYILPIFPALAVLTGRYLVEAWHGAHGNGTKRGLYVCAGLCLSIGGAGIGAVLRRDEPDFRALLMPWVAGVSLAFVIIATVTTTLAIRGRTKAALIVLAGMFVLLLTALNPLGTVLDRRSTKELALTLKARLQPGDEVYCYYEYFQDFPVYLGQLINVVDYEGELHFGIHADPEATAPRFINRAEFVRRWSGPRKLYAIARKNDTAPLFAEPGFKYWTIAEQGGNVLFSNRKP